MKTIEYVCNLHQSFHSFQQQSNIDIVSVIVKQQFFNIFVSLDTFLPFNKLCTI